MSSKVETGERKYSVILAAMVAPWFLNTVGNTPSHTQVLTELIKVCVHAVRSRDGTHESGFEKGGPLIGQTPQPTHIILKHKPHTLSSEPSCPARSHKTPICIINTQTVIHLTDYTAQAGSDFLLQLGKINR